MKTWAAGDTETTNRRGRGEYCYFGIFDGREFRESFFPRRISDILDFLYDQPADEIHFWNLSFDERAIFHPRFLNRRQRIALEHYGIFQEADFGPFELKSIPGKMVQISAANSRRKIYLLDTKQFYGGSLRAAAKKFLPEGPQKFEIPRSWYNEMDRCFKDKRREKVLEYARGDLPPLYELTRDLKTKINAAGIKPHRLISCASLARATFGDRLKEQKPPDALNNYFESSFFGGRIENRLVGQVKGRVRLFDIHSAYPSVMANFRAVNGASIVDYSPQNPPADFGCYLIRAQIPENWTWGPLACRKKDGGVFYPVGKIETWVGEVGLTLLRETPEIRYEVLEGKALYCTGPKIFKDIPSIYERREDPAVSLAWKLDLNSAYGICAERRDQYLEKMAGKSMGRFFGTRSEVYGTMTNFIYAAAITETTRIRIFKELHRLGKLAIFAATDGILVKAPGKIATKKGLGNWGLEGEYSGAVVLGAGRYSLGCDELVKFRGFARESDTLELVRKCRRPSIYIRMLESPTLREWALAMGNEEFNVLEYVERELTIGDAKRFLPEYPKRLCDLWSKFWESDAILGR